VHLVRLSPQKKKKKLIRGDGQGVEKNENVPQFRAESGLEKKKKKKKSWARTFPRTGGGKGKKAKKRG